MRWAIRATLGGLGSAALLHPIAMVIMHLSAPATEGWAAHPLREAFSPDHIPMAAFFGVLGVVVGTALHHYLELVRVTAAREQRERVARERLESMQQMAGAVCHEFGQPITIIALYAEMVDGKPGDTQLAQEAVRAIAASAERLSLLIHQLQHITTDATMSYPGGARIVDLAAACSPPRATADFRKPMSD